MKLIIALTVIILLAWIAYALYTDHKKGTTSVVTKLENTKPKEKK